MSLLLQGESISETWLEMLDAVVHAPGNRMVHVFATVSDPTIAENPTIRHAVDAFLTPTTDHPKLQSVATVANTIFPVSLYPDPKRSWDGGLDTAKPRTRPYAGGNEEVQAAADVLYERYRYMYPRLRNAHHENERGTYFGRMMGWPGHAEGDKTRLGPINQIQNRIDHIRNTRRDGVGSFNAADLALGNDLLDTELDVQVYQASDDRTRSFPCLVHVDIGVHAGKVNLVGVYRLQVLIAKGYGNLLGLARLQKFIAQQTGFKVGELGMLATLASAANEAYGVTRIGHLIEEARDQVLFPR